jgi:CRP-like cAMP-binding protein
MSALHSVRQRTDIILYTQGCLTYRGHSIVRSTPHAAPTFLAIPHAPGPLSGVRAQVRSTRFPNRVLAALPHATRTRLAASLKPVSLAFGEVLYEAGETVRFIYFPNDSLVSLLTVVDARFTIEVGMVGHEGLVGIGCALGLPTSPVRALVQGAGTALKMSAPVFRKALLQSEPLRRGVLLYGGALLAQVAQTAACNRFHLIDARLARWLLMTRDRVDSDSFRLTHDFLGHMLGVRRVSVTNAASVLKRRGLIEYHRGNINILDNHGLEGAACSCYASTLGSSAKRRKAKRSEAA